MLSLSKVTDSSMLKVFDIAIAIAAQLAILCSFRTQPGPTTGDNRSNDLEGEPDYSKISCVVAVETKIRFVTQEFLFQCNSIQLATVPIFLW